MQGGKHSAAAYSELEKWAYGSVVASATSFVVSAGTGMNLNISTGAGLISDTIARRIGTDATETATVPTASASFNRIDTLVAYIDTAVTPTTSVTDNTNDILKFAVVAGTAASTPVAPTGAAIIAAIGAGKPYMALYDVLVPQNATNTSGMTLTDRRVVLATPNIPDAIVTTAKLGALAVTTAKIAAGAVTYDKLNLAAMPAFLAYPSGSLTLTGGAGAVTLPANNELIDQAGNYNPATYVFTAPAAGIYEFELFATGSNATSSRLICGIQVNATLYNGTQQTDTYSSGICTLTVALAAGGTVTPKVSANPANIPINTGIANTRWRGKRIA